MFKKYSILFGIIAPMLLLLVAISYHQDAPQSDKNTIKHEWKNNYIGKPFGGKAVHDSVNASWLWSILIVV